MFFGANIVAQRVGKVVACLLVVSQVAPVMAEASNPSGNIIVTDDVAEYQLQVPTPVVEPVIENAELPSLPIADTISPVLEYAGQFHLIDDHVIEFSGEVDSRSPDNFARMLKHNPDVTTLKLMDVAGTVDDEANFELARMIRDAALTVYVPADGSVRSGGIELFAAGAYRVADPGAEFLVHSWQDDAGYEANDYPLSDPVHQLYLSFYRDMGLSDDDATGFYLLTNSASFDDALQLSLSDLERFGLIG